GRDFVRAQGLAPAALSSVADETFNVGERIRRMRRQAPRNLHCAVESLAAARFVHQPLPFGFTRIQWLTHEDVHECSWCSDGARQPLRAASTGKETKVCLRQPDHVVAILGNTKIARERELEGTG